MKLKKMFLMLTLLIWSTASINAQVRIACVGNSITAGTGTSDRTKYSYPAQLAGMLGSDYKVLNCGNSGSTMLKKGAKPYWNQQEFVNAKDFDPQIVIIALGTNDATTANWVYKADFYTDYVAMIAEFRKAGKNPRIFVCMPPPSTSGGREPNLVNVRQIIRTIAKDMGTDTIDFYNTLLPYFPGTFPDNLHPNDQGAGIMAAVVYQAITGESYAKVIVYGKMVNIGPMTSTIPLYLKAKVSDETVFNNSETLNIIGLDVGAGTLLYNSGTVNVTGQ